MLYFNFNPYFHEEWLSLLYIVKDQSQRLLA